MSFQRCLGMVGPFPTERVEPMIDKAIILAAALAATCVVPATSAARTNLWFPLAPGSRWVYKGHDGGHRATDVVTVTHASRRVAGVRCRVVLDRVYHEGRLVERTRDWYATARGGTVRYYGEATAELDGHGRVTSTEGSWQAGRGGGRGRGDIAGPPPPRPAGFPTRCT